MGEEFITYLNPCTLCESSCDREPIEIDGKRYAICDNCYTIIKWIIQQETKKKKKK